MLLYFVQIDLKWIPDGKDRKCYLKRKRIRSLPLCFLVVFSSFKCACCLECLQQSGSSLLGKSPVNRCREVWFWGLLWGPLHPPDVAARLNGRVLCRVCLQRYFPCSDEKGHEAEGLDGVVSEGFIREYPVASFVYMRKPSSATLSRGSSLMRIDF